MNFYYEESLTQYSTREGVIDLLRQHRPYLEMLPSLRRPASSIIPIPLPLVRVRGLVPHDSSQSHTVHQQMLRLPCEVGVILCDPDWKVKTGGEIIILIHRDGEDFSDLLGRWRQTQVLLSAIYEWVMPLRYQHIFSEGTSQLYPLFVVFEDTPDRIRRGLRGSCLPFVTQSITAEMGAEEPPKSLAPESVGD